MKALEEVLSRIKELPPFPLVVLKVWELIGKEAPFKEIAQVVELDEALTSEILKIANSPFFGLKRKISSVQEAVVYLGEKYLLEIVTRSASKRYYQSAHEGYELQRGELWKHSVACALASEALNKRLKQKSDHVLFTAALLHDIGKIVLNSFVKEAFDEIIKRVKGGLTFVEAEREVLGIDHAEIGGQIAKRWNFPEEIIDAIQYHHEPRKGGPYARKVHICNVLCSSLGIGAGVDELYERFESELLKELGLNRRDVMALLFDLYQLYEKTQSLFSMEMGYGV
jgi:putative nucleotidyltransferase with HDIG domain